MNDYTQDEDDDLLDYKWWKTATFEAVKEKITQGADINARDKHGNTALMLAACYNDNLQIIKLLLDEGADINARDKDSGTALMFAAGSNGNPDIITLLLDEGADVNAG